LQLGDLLVGSGLAVPPASGKLEIADLQEDSRQVKAGTLFAALPGSKLDGSRFIDQAVAAGAVAVLAPVGTKAAIPVIESPEPRAALARLAARFFAVQPERIVAVTGTNGKTSVASFTRQIFTSLGHKAASLGTLGLEAPGAAPVPSLTTPDAITLHRLLARLAQDGVSHVAMEASSHGIEQHRLDGVSLAAAGFTNLTHDHLDYHGTMEAYRAAKLGLFERLLPPGAAAVVNDEAPDSAEVARIARARGHRLIGYGSDKSDLALLERRPSAGGQQLALRLFGARHDIELPLAGAFQAGNALCALGLAFGAGAELEPALAALTRLAGVRGRLEQVGATRHGATVFVDYAHTPDALETVLTALKPHATGKLVVVFGCGGDRDPKKRPVMGEIASRLADRAIVTDDNPRSEAAGEIRRAVLAGAKSGRLEEIGDRGQAIAKAIADLARGDVLVIAGKGHEQGQIVGSEVRPFDDASVARAALAGRAPQERCA
jgi:UDP-N-acetylmuramoyl-L-alanyl-D-glutamate--2,6-diaminopimelate ligase